MPTLDDEAFETYLKQFRPIVPDALPLRQDTQASSRRTSVLRMWAVGLATVVILSTVTLITSRRFAQKPTYLASARVVLLPQPPLTMRQVNTLLATAPSYKAAVDSLVFPNQGSTIPKDKQSALAVLAKEKIKL